MVLRSVTVPEARAGRIAEVLVAMKESEEGREVLALSKTDRFDAFPNGVEATFAPLNAQSRVLETALTPVSGTQ